MLLNLSEDEQAALLYACEDNGELYLEDEDPEIHKKGDILLDMIKRFNPEPRITDDMYDVAEIAMSGTSYRDFEGMHDEVMVGTVRGHISAAVEIICGSHEEASKLRQVLGDIVFNLACETISDAGHCPDLDEILDAMFYVHNILTVRWWSKGSGIVW